MTSPRLRLPPLAAASATLAAVTAYSFLERPWGLLAFIVVSTAAPTLSVSHRRVRVLWRIVEWTAPIAIPLVLIHGVLNGAYPVTARIGGLVPWRAAGFDYGLNVALNILLFSAVATQWLLVERDDLTDSALKLRLPPAALLLATQSIAIAGIVSRRITNVYAAQQARGIPVGSGLVSRFAAFPSVLVPSVVATLVEAEARAPALVSQGFGSTAPARPPPQRRYHLGWAFVATPILVLAAIAVAGRLL